MPFGPAAGRDDAAASNLAAVLERQEGNDNPETSRDRRQRGSYRGAGSCRLRVQHSRPGTSGSATSPPTATTPTAPASAGDVAFTTSMLNLENQAAALAALVSAHTTTAQVRQFAAGLDRHVGEFSQMRAMMSQWGHAAPAPYAPGGAPSPGTGPGMMGAGDWTEMGHLYGGDFNDHFADAMIASRTAEIALCRAELSQGTSPKARALARTMLTERQAELTQLQAWHHQWEHDNDHDMMQG